LLGTPQGKHAHRHPTQQGQARLQGRRRLEAPAFFGAAVLLDDTGGGEVPHGNFEAAWRAWRPGRPVPRWDQFLPGPDEPYSPDLACLLVQIDIEFRVQAGLPALLGEPYFEHPRLRQGDARPDAARQVELIRWEYQQRWQNGQRPQRGDYEAAFPPHAAALADLRPRGRCPQCRQVIALGETAEALHCPACGAGSPLAGALPPGAAEPAVRPVAEPALDPRDYDLGEKLGGGHGRRVPLVRPGPGPRPGHQDHEGPVWRRRWGSSRGSARPSPTPTARG
jgi:hypothetical protein